MGKKRVILSEAKDPVLDTPPGPAPSPGSFVAALLRMTAGAALLRMTVQRRASPDPRSRPRRARRPGHPCCADLSREQRRGRRGARALDVELGAGQQQLHRLDDLGFGDRDDLIDRLADDRERQCADEGRRHAVGQRGGARDRHGLPGGERGRKARPGLELHCDDAAARPCLLDGGGHAAEQAPASDRARRPAPRRADPPRSRARRCPRRRARRDRRRDARTSARARRGLPRACRRAWRGRRGRRSPLRSRAPRRSSSEARPRASPRPPSRPRPAPPRRRQRRDCRPRP